MGIATALFQYLTERKRAKTQQSQWEREQQLREQMEKRYQEQFGLEKQRTEQELRQLSPGAPAITGTPLSGMGGTARTYREAIPEGPEYKARRLQSALAEKQVGGYMSPKELAELEAQLGETAAGNEAGRQGTRDVLEAQRRVDETDKAWERRKEELKKEHEYRLGEIGAGMKPPKEAEEPLIKPDGTVNIKHFFDTANTLFPTFTFYDLTDPKMIENAKKKIYDIVISRFAPTAEEQGMVSSALDQWFESLFQLASKMSDEEKRKPIDWMEFLKRYGMSVGTSLLGMGPAMAAAQYLTPVGSNVQGAPPSGMNFPQREGLLKRGLNKAKSLLGF
jgi:hypothetical protein